MEQTLQGILKQKIIPVYSHLENGINKKVLSACYQAGLSYFEFTNRNENALKEFYELKKYAEKELPNMHLGAGTIKNIKDAEMFLSAGAKFLVSPLISMDLILFTKKIKELWIPGCATSSEIGLAENNGIKMVKIFPASLLGGPAFIKAMKGPFPKMNFLASGGIAGEKIEIKNYLSEASAVAIGNSFFLDSLDEKALTIQLKNLLLNIRNV